MDYLSPLKQYKKVSKGDVLFHISSHNFIDCFLPTGWRPAARYFLEPTGEIFPGVDLEASGEIFPLTPFRRDIYFGKPASSSQRSSHLQRPQWRDIQCLDLGKGGKSSHKTSFWNPLLEASSSGALTWNSLSLTYPCQQFSLMARYWPHM